MNILSEKQIEEFKEAFTLYDTEGKEEIKAKELGTILRNLGMYVTETALDSYIFKYKTDRETITFPSLLKIIVENKNSTKLNEELIDALGLFAINSENEKKKQIKLDSFKEEIKELIPTMKKEEIDTFIKFLSNHDSSSNEAYIDVNSVADNITSILQDLFLDNNLNE